MSENVYSQIEEYLRNRRYKLTGVRKEMIRIFDEAHKPLTVQEVHQRLHATTADIASIYRSINLFCELGILTKLDFHDKHYRYELSDAFVPHHHHLICTQCGDIANVFEPCLPEGLEEKLHAQRGFTVESHILEFYGLCESCVESSS
jgi:Fur family ferric uptake transcriptional regulator